MNNEFKIIKKPNNRSLIDLRTKVIKRVRKEFPKFNSDLSLLHHYVSKKEINKLRLNLFTYLNKTNWTKNIEYLCYNDLCNEIGKDILIQSKINLSIQMPDDESSILPPHSDCWSADSPFQINLWIPLTDAYSTNSMFIWNYDESLKLMRKIGKDSMLTLSPGKLKIKKNQFIKINFGQILLFNPALIHGNTVNKTKTTRVSLNVRLKSVFTPEPTKANPDRKLGTYYKKFSISKDTRFAIKLLQSGIFYENN